MRAITIARSTQGLLGVFGSWEEAYELADTTFHGLMKIYQRQGRAVPEIGRPVTDGDGVVKNVELALAWATSRYGVVASIEEQSQCDGLDWKLLTLEEALMDSGQDG